MEFSQYILNKMDGQFWTLYAIAVFVLFVGAPVISYRKDKKTITLKDPILIILAIVSFWLLLFCPMLFFTYSYIGWPFLPIYALLFLSCCGVPIIFYWKDKKTITLKRTLLIILSIVIFLLLFCPMLLFMYSNFGFWYLIILCSTVLFITNLKSIWSFLSRN